MNVSLISVDNTATANGVRALSSYLKKHGMSTRLILLRSGYDKCSRQVLEAVKEAISGSGLIGISSMTAYYPIAVQLNRYLKGQSTPVVLGGIHATVDPENCLKDFPVICVGEGEGAFLELADNIKLGKPIENIPNIYSRSDRNIRRNPPRPIVKNLDDLPFPDYDMEHQYIQRGNKLLPIDPEEDIEEAFVVMGSRGCPHNCSYCCNSKLQSIYGLRNSERVRPCSVDYLIGHLEYALRKLPRIKRFWLEDDTFFYRDLDEIAKFSSRYSEAIKKPFEMLCSPETFDAKKLDLLVDSGLSKLILGIQSGSKRINNKIYNRFYDRKRILEIADYIKRCKNLGIYYDFIGLNPYEEEEDIIASIELLRDLPAPFNVYINSLAFYPGTRLYEKAKKDGLDLKGRDHHIDEFIFFRHLLKLRRNKYFHFIFINMYGRHDGEKRGFLKKKHLDALMGQKFMSYSKKLRLISDATINLYCLVQLVYRKFAIKALGLRRLLPPDLRTGLKLFYKRLIKDEQLTLAEPQK